MDTDDEVRDRATLYLTILQQKQASLNSQYILNGWYKSFVFNELFCMYTMHEHLRNTHYISAVHMQYII